MHLAASRVAAGQKAALKSNRGLSDLTTIETNREELLLSLWEQRHETTYTVVHN